MDLPLMIEPKCQRLRLVNNNGWWWFSPTIEISTIDLGYDVPLRYETAVKTPNDVVIVDSYFNAAQAIEGHFYQCQIYRCPRQIIVRNLRYALENFK